MFLNTSFSLIEGLPQRWPRIRTWHRQDSSYFWNRSQKFVNNPTRSHFLFSSVAGVCVIFINAIAKYKDCWMLVASIVAGVWTWIRFSNAKKFRIRIYNFLNRSGVSKCNSGHLWSATYTNTGTASSVRTKLQQRYQCIPISICTQQNID